MPGWKSAAWRYHGDNGHLYAESGEGTPYSETFGTGDVVGCEIRFDEGVTFTKNGNSLGKDTGDLLADHMTTHMAMHRDCPSRDLGKTVPCCGYAKLRCSSSSKFRPCAFHVQICLIWHSPTLNIMNATCLC